MTLVVRRALAGAAALGLATFGLVEGFLGHFAIAALADQIASRVRRVPGWQDPTSAQVRDFFAWYVVALALAAATSLVFLFWNRRPGYRVRLSVYLALFMVLMPLSVYNYAHADMLMNRSVQALVNLVLVILGSILTTELAGRRPEAKDARVTHGFLVFAMAATSVVLPSLLSLLWIANALGIVSVGATEIIGPAAISAIASSVSAVVAILNFRRGSAAPSRIISLAG